MPTTLNAVLIIALLIAPGYLMLNALGRVIGQYRFKSDIEFVVATVAAGVCIQGMAYPWPGSRVIDDYNDRDIDNELLLAVWVFGALLLLPITIGLGLGFAAKTIGDRLRFVGLDETSRTARAWTKALGRPQGMYVRVWLKEDPKAVLGGKYSSLSMASTDNDYQDLFVEELWFLNEDHWPVAPVPNSAGAWISPDSISRIEFIKEQECDAK